MSSVTNPCQYLEAVVDIAVEAGRRILDIYQKSFDVTEKGDGSPLTEADRAAHELIAARLKTLTPNIPLLSEESAEIAYAQRRDWPAFWLVDPLDGTKEFINRNGEFTVNIALMDGGRPVLGVVYVPVPGVSYLACVGRGAFKEQGGCNRHPIKVRDYRGGKAIVVASRSHRGEQLDAYLERMQQAEGEYQTISMGSALKLCLVAEGAADIYPRLGLTSEWDTAAAQCVVEVAGGKVTDIDGKPLRYNKESVLNPFFLVSGGGNYDWVRFTRPR